MTQEEFIEKFCPSYRDRFNSIKEEYKNADDELISALVNLQDKAFEEALQNFADKICNKQRIECANDAKCKFNNDVFSSRSTSIYSIMDAILNAQEPNIEDL